jgi:hypothetical protein
VLDPSATLVANPDLTAAVSQLSAFVSHLTVGGVSAHVLQWAKAQPGFSKVWGVLGNKTKALIAASLAFMGSLGITSAFHYDATLGVFAATFTGITAASVGSHLWGFATSYLVQTAYYRAIIKATAVSGVTPVAGVPAAAPVPVVLAPPPALPYAGGH